MSKVQRPRSLIDEQTLRVQVEDRDVGLWTLDLGLTVSDLRKSFSSPAGEGIDVLRGLSFSAAPGQTVAITGVSGAGKSTLLHLLGGIEAPDHGSIRLGSFDIDRAHRSGLAAFRSRHVGFIFQFHHLLADLNAVENVALPLLVARTSWREAMAKAVRSLEDTGLGARIRHPVGHLSGGEQQRVAVCRALITQPSLVLADEPTGNLDASLGLEIGKTLVNYAHARRALVVVATHNQGLAQLCDRILVLRQGKLIES
ncbi:MAG: ABC transporter ATP-binding protein [Pyrinomonadaceae bacterium]